ncbi:MAG: phosphopantetheine-binding protein, partial [Cyanobacteria bacterium J06573_11]
IVSQLQTGPSKTVSLKQTAQADFASTLAATPLEQRKDVLDAFVCEQVCQILGFADDELDRETGFFDLGLDSLTALELKNSLETTLNLSLPSTLAFDYPTVDALIAYLAERLISTSTTPQPLAAEGTDVEGTDIEGTDVKELGSNRSESESEAALDADLTVELGGDDLIQKMDQKLAELDSIFNDDLLDKESLGGEL